MNRLATTTMALLIVGQVSGSVYNEKGERKAEIRESPYGGFDIYKPNGERIGRGQRAPADPSTIELFDKRGNRLGTIDTNERRKR